MASRFTPLDKLPLFASEEALAAALMGPGRRWNGGRLPLYLNAAASLRWTGLWEVATRRR